jgi:hypothetical protein
MGNANCICTSAPDIMCCPLCLLPQQVLLTEWDISHLNEMGNAYVRAKLYDTCQAAAVRMAALKRKLEEVRVLVACA